jgi:NAD(P)-dependent dehydrogenase (short-subunit alcohol dehydrogenase family)
VMQAEAQFGGLDVVIANAGVNVVGRTAELDERDWDAVLDTNLKGVWNTVRAVAPGMIARGRGGSIILVSSNAGLHGLTRMTPYVASKHGVTGLARAFANEYAAHSIRVNSIHPGSVPGTGMAIGYELHFADDEEEKLFYLGTRGATLPGTILVEDIAAAAAWLASEDARFVTGAQIPIDAGSLTKP